MQSFLSSFLNSFFETRTYQILNSPGKCCRGCLIFGKIMGDYLLYNGVFHKNSESLITADNRGLRYGDRLFETKLLKK
jgi:hypothetical protein